MTRSVGETRTVDGMTAYPGGSGPMNARNCQESPPSVVRAENGRPSVPSDFVAVRNSKQVSRPSTR